MQRLARRLSAVGAAILMALAVGVASGSTPPPGAGYQWAQPGCAPREAPAAQPPASVPISAQAMPLPGMDYAWAQPGTAPRDVSYGQPPAVVPTDASSCSI